MDVDMQDWSKHYALFLPDQQTPYPAKSLPLARAIQGEAVNGAQIYIRRQQNIPDTWISVNARPLLREDGTIRGGVAVFRDITEEKKSLALLERLSAIVEQTDDIVFVTDRSGAISYVNPAFEKITGFSSAEAVGRTPRILKSGEHSPKFYKALWETISTGGVYRDSLINRRKNGELFHCEETITPMKDSQGRITHFISLLKDMTHRRRILAQEFELKMAAVVQKKLYPEKAPSWSGVDVAGEVFPADATCGDYFDYFLFPDNAYGLAIGDVSGHGLGPALVMAEARAYLRCMATRIRGLASLFTRLNQLLLADLEDERFLALMVLSLDPDQGRLCYANAGHLPGYVLSDSGEVKATLKATGPPLGILSDPIYQPSQPISMQPGDLVFMVTDGITESTSPDNDFFDMAGVLRVVREMQNCPAQQIIRGVYKAASAFSHNQPQQDDMSMVLLKFQPGAQST
jgi:sigma-B regulation protein RsbU (phosphoserine phosphatase)